MDLPPAAGPAPVVRTVAYGRPATEALAAAIEEAKTGHPLDPVTVLVASNVAGLSVRRLIGGGTVGGGGLANVSFLTPLRLAELLAADALPGLPITNAVLAAAARRVLRHRPAPFAAVAEHHASEAAVVALYAELSRLRPETLDRLGHHDEHTGALVGIFRAMQRELGDRFYDEDERARAAADRLHTDAAGARALLGRLVWFLPERLTPAQVAVVAATLALVPSTVVVGLCGDAAADEDVRRTCAAAGVAVPEGTGPATPPTGSRIISVSDPDEEVRAVCREILALAEAGTPLDRIGVFHPAPDPYARSLHEQLALAHLPHNGPSRTRLADRVAGRTLLDALALPERRWGRADVLAVAGAGPVRAGGQLVPAAAWEHLSRAAGVVGGLDDWAGKLASYAAQREDDHRRRAAEPGPSEARLAAILDDAHRSRDLAAWVAALAEHLAAVEAAEGWAGKSAAASGLVDHLLGPAGRRAGWPDAEVVAAERVDAALTRLALLDEVDPLPTMVTYRRAVEAELDAPAGRVGRFGDGVVFGPLASAPGLDLDAVFVLGLAEGTCPRPHGEDALLPDEVRAAAGDELPTREARLHDQHRHLLAALAAGRTHRVVLYPRGDLRGTRARLPSRWLLDTASALHGARVNSSGFAALGAPTVHEVASFAHGLATAPAALSLVERDLAVLDRHTRAGLDPVDDPLAGPALRRGLLAQAARRGATFTVWDGNLAGLGVPSPSGGQRLSATAMQSWAACPFRYFLGQVLGLTDRPDPETVTAIAATDRGSLLHEVLERFLGEAITAPGGPPRPGEPWPAAARARMAEIAEDVFERFRGEGRTGRELLWRLERAFLLGDLAAFLVHDARRRAAFASTPVAVEEPFGLDGEPPLTLDVGAGRTLAFRGYIDRVDATPDGGHVVYDYKSGKGSHYGELDQDPVRQGQVLQLGLYAEAVAQRRGGEVATWFWMLNSAGDYQLHGGPWTAAHRARFVEVLTAITDGIEAGTFPARPGDWNLFFRQHDNCRYCAFDRLCPRDRHEHERAKAGAPELAVLDRLLPPEPAADDAEAVASP